MRPGDLVALGWAAPSQALDAAFSTAQPLVDLPPGQRQHAAIQPASTNPAAPLHTPAAQAKEPQLSLRHGEHGAPTAQHFTLRDSTQLGAGMQSDLHTSLAGLPHQAGTQFQHGHDGTLLVPVPGCARFGQPEPVAPWAGAPQHFCQSQLHASTGSAQQVPEANAAPLHSQAACELLTQQFGTSALGPARMQPPAFAPQLHPQLLLVPPRPAAQRQAKEGHVVDLEPSLCAAEAPSVQEPDPHWLLQDILEVAQTSCAVAEPIAAQEMLKQKVAVFFLDDTELDVLGKGRQHTAKAGMYEGRVLQVCINCALVLCCTPSSVLTCCITVSSSSRPIGLAEPCCGVLAWVTRRSRRCRHNAGVRGSAA
jgi:hypothetical protein